MNIGFGITGSFCTHKQILTEIKKLKESGHNILPIITAVVLQTDTRFGKAEDFILSLENITGNKVIKNITEAEPLGPNNAIDVLVIAPCTGNTLSKLANGITDNALTMTAKSHVRNNKPLVIGISTNDALGLNMFNLAKLVNGKNIFFVPFRQDAPQQKPKSLVAEWSKLEETILNAKEFKQIEPMII